MAGQELTGYEDEPRDHFLPLPPSLQSQLYHYERLNQDLSSECLYYRQQLKDKCSRLLELGCGSCLIADDLHRHGFQVTGIDLSREILRFSRGFSPCSLVQMDVRYLGFRPCFEAALIAQNSLNLLKDKNTISSSLKEIKKVLVPPGLLLAHLYYSDSEKIRQPGEKLLQFIVFDHPQGGKIIKETIRSFDPVKKCLTLDQRFKIFQGIFIATAIVSKEDIHVDNITGSFFEIFSC